jgi:hypothetical protein
VPGAARQYQCGSGNDAPLAAFLQTNQHGPTKTCSTARHSTSLLRTAPPAHHPRANGHRFLRPQHPSGLSARPAAQPGSHLKSPSPRNLSATSIALLHCILNLAPPTITQQSPTQCHYLHALQLSPATQAATPCKKRRQTPSCASPRHRESSAYAPSQRSAATSSGPRM